MISYRNEKNAALFLRESASSRGPRAAQHIGGEVYCMKTANNVSTYVCMFELEILCQLKTGQRELDGEGRKITMPVTVPNML